MKRIRYAHGRQLFNPRGPRYLPFIKLIEFPARPRFLVQFVNGSSKIISNSCPHIRGCTRKNMNINIGVVETLGFIHNIFIPDFDISVNSFLTGLRNNKNRVRYVEEIFSR